VLGPTAALGAAHQAPSHRVAPQVRARAAGADRTAHNFAGTPTVGALFLPGVYPMVHTCTASVVRSRGHDVIVTAAHCIGSVPDSGSGSGYSFAPGYHDGQTPYGVWTTTAVYGSPKWIHQRKASTQRDWAFLRVAGQRRNGKVMQVQDVVGGNRLGAAPKPGTKVRVPGYGVGAGDKPITCRAPVYRHRGYPAFDCGGYVGGVSGSPWLAGHRKVRTIVGIIGGLHQGGCTPATSYSSRIGRAAHAVLRRASQHRAPDTFPAPPGDGC
jgi:V8-like Glu-specific endopeptidase